ncbi:hypothetical protein V5T82_15355 [Magnetovibrio sp. PR-2]|uniref:hypothetical protein n=1 Tax=Magnetovibrio sp. PR-2 TaxID=3120356 RepID=UPI002FCE6186
MTFKHLISVGDIVVCRFPMEETPGEPGPKSRPCLVTRVYPQRSFRAHRVEVAFGTSVQKPKPGPKVFLRTPEDIERGGVKGPTQFLLHKRAIVPQVGRFLCRSKKDEVQLGNLTSANRARLEHLLHRETADEQVEACRFGRKPTPSINVFEKETSYV